MRLVGKKQMKKLIKALQDIANPLARLTKEAERDGDHLHGMMAVRIANDPNYLKKIAKDALKEVEDTLFDPEIVRLRRALNFYADPRSYHAIAFAFDRPCGAFEGDFDEAHGDDYYNRPMPGKRAREVLDETSEDALLNEVITKQVEIFRLARAISNSALIGDNPLAKEMGILIEQMETARDKWLEK